MYFNCYEKKKISSNISYELILDVYKKHKIIGLRNLFGEDENGNILVTKSDKVLKKIASFRETTI